MLELNLKTKAATQTTLPFNSMCRFGHTYLGATSTGLHRLGGYTDNGVAIPALLKTGKFDLGTERFKSIRYFYLGLETTGELMFTLYVDGSERVSVRTQFPGEGQQTIKIKIPRGLKGRYWEFKLENIDGCFFAIYSVRILPVILKSA